MSGEDCYDILTELVWVRIENMEETCQHETLTGQLPASVKIASIGTETSRWIFAIERVILNQNYPVEVERRKARAEAGTPQGGSG